MPQPQSIPGQPLRRQVAVAVAEKPPISAEPAVPLPTRANCMVSQGPDGYMECRFRIEPDIARRIKLRAGSMDLADYIWSNILRAALTSHVY